VWERGSVLFVFDRSQPGEPTMALTKKPASRWWSRLHFFIRFAGLTGLVCAGAGVAWAYLDNSLERVFTPDLPAAWEYVRATLAGERASPWAIRLAVGLLAGGTVLAVVALLTEALMVLFVVAGRRSAFGLNAAVQ